MQNRRRERCRAAVVVHQERQRRSPLDNISRSVDELDPYRVEPIGQARRLDEPSQRWIHPQEQVTQRARWKEARLAADVSGTGRYGYKPKSVPMLVCPADVLQDEAKAHILDEDAIVRRAVVQGSHVIERQRQSTSEGRILHLVKVGGIHGGVGQSMHWPHNGDHLVEGDEADAHEQWSSRLESQEIRFLDDLIAADQYLTRGRHGDTRRPHRHAAENHLRALPGHVDHGDSVGRVALRNEEGRLCGIAPGKEERCRQALDDRLARAIAELKAAHSSRVRPGGLFADVGELQVRAKHQAHRILQARKHGGLGAGGQIDLPQMAGGRILDDIGLVIGLVEKKLLRCGHSG